MNLASAWRCAPLALLAGTFLFAPAPLSAHQSAKPVIKTGTAVITCAPGYVYRCSQRGCFCVKA